MIAAQSLFAAIGGLIAVDVVDVEQCPARLSYETWHSPSRQLLPRKRKERHHESE
jgi:hypothetical protein